jgi:hypothetical protein
MATETIRIQNRDIPLTRERVPVALLRLDPRNPRIQYLIGRYVGDIPDQKLDELLWDKEQVKALAQSILQNGGVFDPIIVQRNGDGFIVREGNSRTVALRHLAAKHEGDDRFTTVPAMVFDDRLSEEDLAVLLADLHVTGKIRWDAYEQAKHVSELYHGYGKTYEWLSTHLRLSKSRITQDLKAYEWTTTYLKHHPDPKNLEKFAFFQELARKKELANRYANEPSFRQEFDQWLAEDRLTASAQVRQLEQVLANDGARKQLDEAGFEAAATVLIKDDPALASGLYDAVKRATEQLKRASMTEIQDLSENPQKLIMLRNLHRAIEDLATLANVKL